MRINAIFSNANEALFNKIMTENVPTLCPKSEFDTMKARNKTFTDKMRLNHGSSKEKEARSKETSK